MLAVREHVREKIKHDIHAHTLMSRLYHKAGNIPMSKVEHTTAAELVSMLHSLAHEDEPMHGTDIRTTG